MLGELEKRLQRSAESLPSPSDDVSARAWSAAVAALPEGYAQERAGGTRARSWFGRVLLVGGALTGIAAVSLAVLLAPWKGESPLATERALAAIGQQPVIHTVIEKLRPQATMIDLTSGAKSLQFVRWELWYDGARSLLRMRLIEGGQIVPGSELLQTKQGSFTREGADTSAQFEPRFDPALTGFVTRYRRALKNGQAKAIGQETIDGRKAIVIRIRLRAGTYEDVALDAHSYRPLRLRSFRNGATPTWQSRVIQIETLARTKDQFARPKRSTTPLPRQTSANNGRTVSPTQAATVLGHRAYWPGISVSLVPMTRLALVKVTTRWSNGRQTTGHALDFRYGSIRHGPLSGRWLEITEATSRQATLLYSSFDVPALPPGQLRIIGGAGTNGAPAMWLAAMRKDGVYIVLRSRQRSLIVNAAQLMTQIPGR